MRIAHLILAHKNPAQLERMINALNHPAFDFYIHLDKKAEMNSFAYLSKKENVFFIQKRVHVKWAGYSLVQAQLNGIEEVVAINKYDYINILSAQDFPLKPSEYIFTFLKENKGAEFISTVDEQKDPEWWNTAKRRVTKYHLESWKKFPGKYRLQSLMNFLTGIRKYPLPHKIVGRSQWFTITNGAAIYMINFIKSNPKIVRFFKYVWGADEFIFSTVLYNSPFKEKIRDDLFYIDWSEGKPNPKILREEDFEKLIRSNKVFARKFDAAVDEKILKKLEEHIRPKLVV